VITLLVFANIDFSTQLVGMTFS